MTRLQYQSKAQPKEGGFGNTEGRALHKMDDDMWIKKRKQMVVTEDSENVWHSLPSQKKRRMVHRSHSLSAAVSAKRAVEKKH